MTAAPIVLFVYNRLDHARLTLEALSSNHLARDSSLFIFSDAPKSDGHEESVLKVRRYIRELSGFKEIKIIERAENLGLSRSIVSGVSEVLEKWGRAIVLEDDIRTAPGFLTFMNEALSVYEEDKRIFAVSGWTPSDTVPPEYPFDAYLSYRPLCWGWATWKDRWQAVDWAVSDFEEFRHDKNALQQFARGGDDLVDMLARSVEGKTESWAVRWAYAQFKSRSYCLVSATQLADNIGLDDSGVHSHKPSAQLRTTLDPQKNQFVLPREIQLDEVMARALAKAYRYNYRAKIKRLLGLL